MKTTYATLCVGLFVILFYALWVLTMPFFVARLFLNAAAGEDDDLVVGKYSRG